MGWGERDYFEHVVIRSVASWIELSETVTMTTTPSLDIVNEIISTSTFASLSSDRISAHDIVHPTNPKIDSINNNPFQQNDY